MPFTTAIRTCFRSYATFSGRVGRSEPWWFCLLTLVLTVASSLIAALALVVPTLAVMWRRLHDTDRTGAWFFLVVLPGIGTIVLAVLRAQEGTRGPNRFGASV